MPRGGDHGGRVPAANSVRKDRAAKRAAKGKPTVVDDGDWLTLPREGRGGNPPAWPLTQADPREREVWRRLWKRPQALAWERLGVDPSVVALHVRMLVRAERPNAPIGLGNLVRMQQDGLGLTAPGMRMLRWRVSRADAASDPAPRSSQSPPTGLSPKERFGSMSVRDRLQIVSFSRDDSSPA